MSDPCRWQRPLLARSGGVGTSPNCPLGGEHACPPYALGQNLTFEARGATGQVAKLPQLVQLAQPRPQYGVRSASPGPQQRNRVQTKSGALRAIPVLLALIFITTAAMEKRTMSVRMAVANERALFVLVNIALSPWFGSRCTDRTSVPH
jgi:hypothetical protein